MTEGIDVPEASDRTLNRMVAVTVVAISVMMALGNIKDGNIVQNMQADQATKIDVWNEYQAAKLKGHISALAATIPGNPTAAAEVTRYRAEAESLKKQATDAQADYDLQGRRDDQFDLAEGFNSIGLAVSGISALTESRRLLSVGWIAAGLGLLFLVAGFLELPVHPDRLVAFLT